MNWKEKYKIKCSLAEILRHTHDTLIALCAIANAIPIAVDCIVPTYMRIWDMWMLFDRVHSRYSFNATQKICM